MNVAAVCFRALNAPLNGGTANERFAALEEIRILARNRTVIVLKAIGGKMNYFPEAQTPVHLGIGLLPKSLGLRPCRRTIYGSRNLDGSPQRSWVANRRVA